jgi:hypothetical protein
VERWSAVRAHGSGRIARIDFSTVSLFRHFAAIYEFLSEVVNMESSRVRDAKAGKAKERARLRKKNEAEKRRQAILDERERKKDGKAVKRSEGFPARAEILSHEDGYELIIKPYPFSRLYVKCIRLSAFVFIMGVLAGPAVL